jgi:hypothetical protein
MSSDYDKIIKENIEAIFLPLAEKYLGISIKTSRKLPGKLQSAIEREPDFARIVKTKEDEEFILHIEFQTVDEKDMVYRMAEYHSILLRKYKLPIRQFVVFLGNNSPKMRTKLDQEEVMKGFGLVNLHALDYKKLLASQIPEEIILAILSKFDIEVERVIELIIRRLQKVSDSKIVLQKYVIQLSILSRLRNLEEVVTQKSREMPITYDIKKDYLYRQGRKEGIEKGIEKERLQKEIEKKEQIIKMLQSGILTVSQIAEFSNTPEAEVKKIQATLKK